jgi:hypothetical protein
VSEAHRTVVVAVRLTPKEARELLDSRRGAISRSAFIRWRLMKDAQADTFQPT